jgi:uncharacterized protein (TIGR00369 family)
MSDWQPSPFIKLMGVRIVSRTPERSEAEVVNREDLCNRRKVMHGGAIMALADIMGGMTATAGLPAGSRTATIESKTNFFAAIQPGDTVRAVCTPLHTGRTTIVLQTNITRGDGKLAALVIQTQIVLPKGSGAAPTT